MNTYTQNLVINPIILITIASSLILMSCQKETEKVRDNIVYVSTDARQTSDELTKSAEQLVGPYTFMLAYSAAESAIEKDPTNLKARFYYLFLKRYQAFKGAITRVRPLLNKQEVENMDYWIKNFPKSPLKEFLTAEGIPLKKPTDFQDVLGQYYLAIREFRQFLKENQDANLELYLNPYVFEQEIKKEMADSCRVVDNGVSCTFDYSSVATKKLNKADLIALRQISAGELIYSMFVNSYSLEGLEQLKQVDPQGAMTNQQRTEFLSNIPTFGKLRKDQNLTLMKDMGSDLVAGIRWAQQNQEQLCPAGVTTPGQRKGYLFSHGFCVSGAQTEVSIFLATLEQALAGVTKIDFNADGVAKSTNVNAFAWSKQPIMDLRQIKPTAWNNCDQAISFADNTLGGIFVDNNVNVLNPPSCNN